MEVESTLEVPFLWMGRDEETLEGYFDSVVVHMGRVPVRWWVDIWGSGVLSEVHRYAACVV